MPKKAPPVFLDYDQAALDAAYDQAAYAPNREQLIKRRIRDSERARQRIGDPERAAYGAAEIEQLDIYRTGRAASPVFIFIHGGAWRSGRSRDFVTPAEMFTTAGAHYVVPDFAWVQDVGGSLIVLADQVCRTVAWVHRNAADFGGDPNRLYLGGQSSGGHLAARADNRLAAQLWPAGRHHQRRHVHQRHVRSGAGAAVGAQRLCQIRRCDGRRTEPDMPSRATARAAGRRLRHLRDPRIPASEPRIRNRGQAAGKRVQLLVGEHYNHFELPETLANPYGLLGRAVLDLMGLPAGGAQ